MTREINSLAAASQLLERMHVNSEGKHRRAFSKHASMLHRFLWVVVTANTSSCLQSRGAACKGLFPWKPRSALARNEVGFLVACRAADGEEKCREANLNVTKMSGFSHIPLDPFPPFQIYFFTLEQRDVIKQLPFFRASFAVIV